MNNNKDEQDEQVALVSRPLQLYRPLHFWFCKKPGHGLAYWRNTYAPIDVKRICLKDISSNHEFYEDICSLNQNEIWVPKCFPAIESFIDIKLAQLVANMGIANREFTVVQNCYKLRLESFPSIWIRDLRTDGPWIHHPMKLEIRFPDFESIIANQTENKGQK